MLTEKVEFDNKKINPPSVTGGEPLHGEVIMDDIATYRKHRLSFFPLRKKSKRPIEEWKIFMVRPPSAEEEDEWKSKKLLCQVAIVTGQVSDYIVLDEDDPPVFQPWLKENNYHLPQTAKVKTSTFKDDQGNTHQKFHYYFKHPGGKIKNMIKKIPGADIKADGGYVVAPPSIHPNGEQYEWCSGLTLDDYPDTPAPPWLLKYLNYEVDPTVEINEDDQLPPDGDWVTEALKGVNRGERNNAAAKLAGYYLAKGEPESRVLETLRGWNLRNPEPLPDKELQTTVASIARKEARNRIKNGAQEGKSEPASNVDLPWEEQRQAALQGLAERLGLPITDIKVTKSDESSIEFILGEADSVVMTAKELCEQRLFKIRFASAGLLVPKKVKEPKEGGVWDEVVRQVFRLATLQDVGQESSALGELREFLDNYVEGYGVNYYPPDRSIPHHVAFFIIQRKGEKPQLYARTSPLFVEARQMGLYYSSLKKLTVLLPSLGHEPEKFKWNRKTIRAWAMNLDSMSPDIKEMVFRKAIEGKDREDSLQDKR